MSDLFFYLGTHRPSWLWSVCDVRLFVSHRTLRERRTRFPRATTPWALDSGGFTELSIHGQWKTSVQEYVDAVHRYDDELGCMEWAAPQDWMCEPFILAKTGLTVREHQARTIANFLTLTDLAPDLGFMPVLQGWTIDDYHRHADDYAAAGVDLTASPLVGVGSVCRRQATGEIGAIFGTLRARGLQLHGFGVKAAGLRGYADSLLSADSLAWSLGARRSSTPGTCGKRSCSNCLHYALAWRRDVLSAVDARPSQLELWEVAA